MNHIYNFDNFININNLDNLSNLYNFYNADNSLFMLGGAPVKKWSTLEHNGVMFYPEYESHGISITYGSEEIKLNPEAEEYITYFVNKKYDKYRNDKFNKNFFKDWKKLLNNDLQKRIIDFSLCDFTAIKNYIEEQSIKKKEISDAKTKEEKIDEKRRKEDEMEKYKYAIVDGQKQEIDNYLIEPPTIFVGRGSHPLSGSIKKRLYPEDIILNVGSEMEIPKPGIAIPKGEEENSKYKWGDIIIDNTLEWIASWQNNITLKYNYTRFGKKSSFKMKSDESKYDLARKLKKKIRRIREINENSMMSGDETTIQLATALFLIDRLALRIGNEKKSDEADTVGVTTLKVKNITPLDNNTIKFDFLGKDSIRYVNKYKVPSIVYENILKMYNKADKGKEDDLFDLITSDDLNKYIKGFMKKLTSKVFRTYNASYLMQLELTKISNNFSEYEGDDKFKKVLYFYQMANLKVAKLCNHQKTTVSGQSAKSIEKTQDKIKDLKSNLNKYNRQKKKMLEEGKKTIAINKKITKIKDKIKLMKNKKSLQVESKTLSTGTSKTNYIDPRITITFLKKLGLMDNIDSFFNESQQKQFKWALDVDETYRF